MVWCTALHVLSRPVVQRVVGHGLPPPRQETMVSKNVGRSLRAAAGSTRPGDAGYAEGRARARFAPAPRRLPQRPGAAGLLDRSGRRSDRARRVHRPEQFDELEQLDELDHLYQRERLCRRIEHDPGVRPGHGHRA